MSGRFEILNAFIDNAARHLSPRTQCVWFCLFRFADASGNAYLTRDKIGELTGCHRRNVSTAIAELYANNYLKRGDKFGYQINTECAQYCTHVCTILHGAESCTVHNPAQGGAESCTPVCTILHRGVHNPAHKTEHITEHITEQKTDPPTPQGGEDVESREIDIFGNAIMAPTAPSKATLSTGDVQAVVTTWNQYPSLPAARGISEKRDKAIRAVLKDKATRDLWQESIAKIAASPHHVGVNERGWRADFDWWCRPDRVLRFAEMGLAPAKTTEQVNADSPEIVVYLSKESLIAHTGKDPKHEDVWMVYCHKYGLPDCLAEQYAVNGPDKESPFGKIELAEMHNTPIKVTYID